MIPGFNRADELDPPTSPPDPNSTVRDTLTAPQPPAPMLTAASAWRSTVRPAPPPPRRSGWGTAAAMALICAALSAHVWLITPDPPEARTIARSMPR